MAEERNLGLARATEQPSDADATKAELQRRMDEARESITQTVTEIKETVVNQYQQVRESISDTLDWREQYRRRPLPFTIGAFGAGLLLGYSVAGAFGGSDDDEDFDTEDAAFDRIERGFDQLKGAQPQRSYAASPVIGAAHTGGAYQRTSHPEAAEASAHAGSEARPSYSSGYQAPTAPPAQAEAGGLMQLVAEGAQDAAEEEPKGPGIFQRFKETKAYDRLQDEISTLGERAVEELSKTARNVVLPALLSKLKDMIGIDLSTQREVVQRGRLEHQVAETTAATSATEEGATTTGKTAPGGPTANAAGAGSGSQGTL